MGRILSATMQQILAAKKREIDYTLALTFPDATYFRFATAPLPAPYADYTNDLESVKEIYQTLESPTDGVGVAVQNKDRVLGLHVAAHWRKWRKAEAVIGRLYRDADGLGLSEWKEMFRGAVQQPNANDFQVTFDIIPDTLAPGDIVCNRTLALACGFVFKDPKTCAYAGSETLCNHFLNSPGGCVGRANTPHFGGMEHNYPPEASVPGTGGNGSGDGDVIDNPPCPRLDQYVLARGTDGQPIAKMVAFVTESDFLFNPISGDFHAVHSAEVVEREPIFELIAASGAVSYSSFSHRIIKSRTDGQGTAAIEFQKLDDVLTLIEGELVPSRTVYAAPTGETGDVMRIELADGHIYAAGDSVEKFVVAHNLKNPYDHQILV